jgi:hypothetical protein
MWAQDQDHPTWLVSMQSTKTGELRWFPSLEALIQYLREEFGNCEPSQKAEIAALPEKDNLMTTGQQMDKTARG